MIKNKEDYKYYLLCDSIANKVTKFSLKNYLLNKSYSYLKLLRRAEYYNNCKKSKWSRIVYLVTMFRLLRKSRVYGWYIPINTFGPGLSIAHEGTIIVNSGAKIGSNCRIHVGVNIGTSAGADSLAPEIGDNSYIGPGVKMFGRIKLGNNIAIGANSVVNKSFSEDNITLAGIPAKVVSTKGSEGLYIRATEVIEDNKLYIK